MSAGLHEDGGKRATGAMSKLLMLMGKIPHNSSPAKPEKSAPQEVARLGINNTNEVGVRPESVRAEEPTRRLRNLTSPVHSAVNTAVRVSPPR